ncbi:putative secreted protein [Wickerhamomyces ciferrii]|uniref:Secreted protein n=1 Tax=Wickerhamomyces ciferrii (strain ATCC 14091 / BCRC 22168 / CBS 111 / JCM 3599 / NBRC 0793 / NRRL Y-1031 F-60-10) TaxID=1206466 RepID=K0KJJ0_WICCF|nr:uncharacterized protein BN7_5007 [Wickerhamomyces ciferrii]CCH45425.1 putative secreted protein [Wickerhamomyces ciferrii]
MISLFKAFLISLLICSTSAADSETFGSLAIKPVDYDKYGETIDLKLIRYLEDGTVYFFVDQQTIPKDTKTFRNATILSSGQLANQDGNSSSPVYLQIDETSGLVSAGTNSGASSGVFSIEDGSLYFQYHKIFVACQGGSEAQNYTLIWRGASSPAVCENDWLLVYMNPYGTSSSVADYYPDNYVSSIASTASDSTETSTMTAAVSATESTVSSVNGAGLINPIGSGATVLSGLSLLTIVVMSLIY